MNFFKGLVVGYLLRGNKSTSQGSVSTRDNVYSVLLGFSFFIFLFGNIFFKIIATIIFVSVALWMMLSPRA